MTHAEIAAYDDGVEYFAKGWDLPDAIREYEKIAEEMGEEFALSKKEIAAFTQGYRDCETGA